MSVNALTTWLNPIIMLVGLVALIMLQTNDKPVTSVVYVTASPLQETNH